MFSLILEGLVNVVSHEAEVLHPCTRARAGRLVDKGHAERLGENAIVLLMTRQKKGQIRQEVLERDKYICRYCGKKLNPQTATVDHVIPKSKMGSSFADNLVCSCEDCNIKKGDSMPEQKKDITLKKGDGFTDGSEKDLI